MLGETGDLTTNAGQIYGRVNGEMQGVWLWHPPQNHWVAPPMFVATSCSTSYNSFPVPLQNPLESQHILRHPLTRPVLRVPHL